ncbi:putative membrane protein YdjX (TVP38/TMEM64 family) [Paucibacter oligotrophus]|uniref:TVP38/TMEM64 family membrane protein n=1 Tax=Roseateles oligotrophus TaxID=1769250 RepID=A0A840L816_9BURK|nr:TVP38/TMEM64 family protein [Roseateles oligotrophus]MBB4843911.1 putative membrane protein YdjX (TVP38/TMEM64 family) [Roseateles oligotrophus]
MPADDDQRRRLRRRLLALALCLGLLLALALAWSGTPLRQSLNPELLLPRLQALGQATGPAWAVLALGLALCLAIPLTLLSLLVIAAFGPLTGFFCAMGGALLGAALSHGLGQILGHEALCRIGGPRINQISQSLGQRGLLAVIALRLVPIAPFAVVNLVAGATHIRLWQMLLGTALGMLPSTLVMAFFLNDLLQALQQASPWLYALLGLGAGLIALAGWLARRWLRQLRQDARTS